jgi:hypothetical protein
MEEEEPNKAFINPSAIPEAVRVDFPFTDALFASRTDSSLTSLENSSCSDNAIA